MKQDFSSPSICQQMDLMRHDLRNRLSALKLELYLLERNVNPALRETVKMMKLEIGEMNQMIDGMNDLSCECHKS